MNNLSVNNFIPLADNKPYNNNPNVKFSKKAIFLECLTLVDPLTVAFGIGLGLSCAYQSFIQTTFDRCVSIINSKSSCQFLQGSIEWSSQNVLAVWENCHANLNPNSQICNTFLEINNGTISINNEIFQSTNLLIGIQSGDLEKVKEALKNGVDPNGVYGNGKLIHLACELGNREIVRALIDNGADFNSTTKLLGHTALHRACILGHSEIVEELISRNADVNYQFTLDPWQYQYGSYPTPLEYAINSECYDCCRLLIKAGASLKNNENSNSKHNILSSAISTGNYAIVKLLLDSCIDMEFGDYKPLCTAANFPDILQLMLDRKANVNSKNALTLSVNAGNQPLHEAVISGNVQSVRILIKAKAPLSVKNSFHQTPLDIAKLMLKSANDELHKDPNFCTKRVENYQLIVVILENEYARRKKSSLIYENPIS